MKNSMAMFTMYIGMPFNNAYFRQEMDLEIYA
ncbi:hypothetical protein JOC76_000860 [Neobacillus cucumis]|nr:hypothetical protein [Neobacillus cucumis]